MAAIHEGLPPLSRGSHGQAVQALQADARVTSVHGLCGFQRVLEAFGFNLDRIKGSHHIYRHPAVPRPLSIQPVKKMAKPYQIDQFLDNVEEFGLTIDE